MCYSSRKLKIIFDYLIKGYEFAYKHNLTEKVGMYNNIDIIAMNGGDLIHIIIEGNNEEMNILKEHFYTCRIESISIKVHGRATISFKSVNIIDIIKQEFPKEYRNYNIQKLLEI